MLLRPGIAPLGAPELALLAVVNVKQEPPVRQTVVVEGMLGCTPFAKRHQVLA